MVYHPSFVRPRLQRDIWLIRLQRALSREFAKEGAGRRLPGSVENGGVEAREWTRSPSRVFHVFRGLRYHQREWSPAPDPHRNHFKMRMFQVGPWGATCAHLIPFLGWSGTEM
jgi:hypothetical protein